MYKVFVPANTEPLSLTATPLPKEVALQTPLSPSLAPPPREIASPSTPSPSRPLSAEDSKFIEIKMEPPGLRTPLVIGTINEEGDDNLNSLYESSFKYWAGYYGAFLLADTNGKITLWSVGPTALPDDVAPIHLGNSHISGNFADAWKSIEPPQRPVTASLVLEDQLLFIRGHDNGNISTCTLPTDPFPKYNKAHAARVNCLMCSPPNPHAPQRRLLVSGSDDCTVKVWELASFELLHTFSHHTGPVTHVFPPPPRYITAGASVGKEREGSVWDHHTFFSVSEDKNVVLYSLDSMVCRHLFGTHPALISQVKWRREQDYLLIESIGMLYLLFAVLIWM